MTERLTVRQVAKLYGTSPSKVRARTEAGEIPYHRIESFTRSDGTTGERFVYLRSIVEADLRRRGELHAERSAS